MNKRIFLIDNVRAILIFLVVLGHFIEPYKNESTVIVIIYGLIYAFHMPLFAMVSGYFSKMPTKKEIFSLFRIFIAFEIIYAVISGLMLLLFPSNMQEFFSAANNSGMIGIFINLLTPIWLLWYLLALIFWKLLLHFFGHNKKMILAAILLSLAIGFVDLNGRFLTYQRMFGMFSFFLIGYYINYETIIKIKTYKYSLLYVVTTLLMVMLIVPKIVALDVELFYYADSYSHFVIDNYLIVIIRMVLFLLSMMMCYTAVYLIPDREMFFTKFGTNTIGIYLGHGLLFLLLMGLGLFAYIEKFSDLLIILLMIITSYIVMSIMNQNVVIKLINKITFNERKR